MDKSSKVLKTVTISEIKYSESDNVEDCLKGKTFFFVNVEVPQEDDCNERAFELLSDAEEYASDVAKRPLKSIKNADGYLTADGINAMILGER